jgi:hypothetical protein
MKPNQQFIDHQTRGYKMSNQPLPPNDDEIRASREKSHTGYGQNGFAGASSDLPGQETTSGFLPKATIPDDGWQMRPVGADQADATAYGMRDRNASPTKIAAKNNRGGK